MTPKFAWMEKSWDPSGVSANQLQEFGFTTLQELQAARDARMTARKQLSAYLARQEVTGPEKQRARCAYIHKHGRLPYQCSGCWLLPGNCVCPKLRASHPRTRVVIHLHQDEWGRGSNTGCLCAGSLSNCQLLLRGHAPHDDQLSALLSDPTHTTALLWPGDEALEVEELQQLAAARSEGRITLIAIDATWSCAVKMRRKYPADTLTVKLPPDLALPQLHHVEAVRRSQQQPSQHPGASPNGSMQGSDAQQQAQRSSVSSLTPADSPKQRSGSIGSGAGAVAGATDSSTGYKSKGAKHIPSPGERVSLFRGVRKYHGKAAENGRVSTLEAVAAALLALEGNEDMYQRLLYNLAMKVDAMRHQKHMPLEYDSGDDADEQVLAANT